MTLSAIICTHDPDLKRLERVFRALAAQTLPPAEWECILVDNASRADVARQFDLRWHPAGRVVREEALGLTAARLRGIAEAQGEGLVFVDDDCLLDPDYLAQTAQTFREHPFLGALGGYGRAEYETPPPAWLTPSLRHYHLDQPPPDIGNDLLYAQVLGYWGPWFPIGAGLCIRRELARHYAQVVRADPVALGFDRTGKQLAGGGDLDMGICTMERGYAIGRSRRLRFVHVVPAFRMELDYMLRLLYMSQYTTERLLVHRGWKKPVPPTDSPAWRSLKRWVGGLRSHPPEDRCWQALARGRIDGLAGAPLDPRFCGR